MEIKNIYDLAGNVYEWINEFCSICNISGHNKRGGNYMFLAGNRPVSVRAVGINDVGSIDVTSRLQLYIK